MIACLPAHAVQEQGGVDNPAAVLYGINDLRYENHHITTGIPHGHVRVQMRAVGICGSDVHFYKKVPFGWPRHCRFCVPICPANMPETTPDSPFALRILYS